MNVVAISLAFAAATAERRIIEKCGGGLSPMMEAAA